MPRLIASLAAAAAVLADQAADRLDTWVENTTTADAPRETPLGFAVPNGLEMPDEEAVIKAAAARVAGEQRDRWLAAVKGRLDASTGGPWVTDRGNLDVITSPYGVIATGVIRDGDRALIEDARADLYGLLALAEEDARLIAAWEGAAKSHESRRAETERELAGMHEREAAVERVLDSLVDGRLKLDEYIDPETPAGRVAELVTTLLTQIRDAENGAQVQHLTDALHVANSNNAAMKRELDRARALLEAAQQDGSASHLEVAAVMGAYDRGIDFDAIDVREDSLAERVLTALRKDRERIEAETKRALESGDAMRSERTRADTAERKLERHHRHDEAELTTADNVRAAAAARIREAIELCEDESRSMFTKHEVDAEGYLAGLRDAVKLVIDTDDRHVGAQVKHPDPLADDMLHTDAGEPIAAIPADEEDTPDEQ